MCGLVGVVGKIWGKEEQAFKMMLELDTTRGRASTGALSVLREPGKWLYYKDVGTGYDLTATEGFGKLMRRSHGLLLGHNRAPTKGAVTLENAHPFDHGDIIGSHNGTLTNQSKLKDHEMFDVDSDNIFYNIAEEGVHETLSKLVGAFALTWYDAGKHVFQMVRNHERPLTFCYSKDKKTLFWSSESWILHIALGKAGIEFDEPKQLEPKKLMTIECPTISDGNKMGELVVNIEDVEFYEPPVYKDSSWWHKPRKVWRNNQWYDEAGNLMDDYYQKTTQAQPTGATGSQTSETGTGTSSQSLLMLKGPTNQVSQIEHMRRKKIIKDYVNKSITFSVVRYISKVSQNYFSCDLENDNSGIEVRIFTKDTTTLGKMLADSTCVFKGMTNGYCYGDFGIYIRVDHRTIVEVMPVDDKSSPQDYADSTEQDKKMLITFKQEYVSLEEWYNITKDGCMECGDFALVKNAPDLFWVSRTDWFCPKCKNGNRAAEYHQNYYHH